MAKATRALSTEIISNPAIAAAAADIHTLINGQPRSPTKDELAAIIAKAVPTPDVVIVTRFLRHVVGEQEEVEPPRLRAEWDTLATELTGQRPYGRSRGRRGGSVRSCGATRCLRGAHPDGAYPKSCGPDAVVACQSAHRAI